MTEYELLDVLNVAVSKGIASQALFITTLSAYKSNELPGIRVTPFKR